MRPKKYYTFGLVMLLSDFLTKTMRNTLNGKDTYFLMKDVVYVLSYGNCTCLYMLNGDKFTYTKTMKEVCSWFPDNFFASYFRGEFINKNMIISHTGKFEKVISIYLPLNWISIVAKDQRSNFLLEVDFSLVIKTLTEIEKVIVAVWVKTERKIRKFQ